MSAIPPIPGAQPTQQAMPDLSGLAAGLGSAQDPSTQFMQLAKQLEDQAMAIASAHPQFSKAAEAIKKAIQQGTVEVVGSMQQPQSAGPDAGVNYNG
jgi:hypothetical protein